MKKISQYALDHAFNKHVNEQNETMYWRECVLQPDMKEGEQGYIVVWDNGDCIHTYHYPPTWI